MKTKSFSLMTKKKEEFINITPTISDIITEENISSGLITIFVPHTTAGIIINESADPNVATDILNTLRKIVPDNGKSKHFEGNSSAHIKTVITGSSISIPVENAKMELGIWQGIFFCEFDGPRNRRIQVVL